MRAQDRTPERLGPYRLVRRLGEGGMGVVYLATDPGGDAVAVKALHPGLAQEGNARRRMGREVETMQRVRSPHVAEVLDADLDGEPPYIVTRYVPGLPLDDVVGAGGPLTGPALARLACGLAEALAAVHAAGVVHRDLKPGNVMISDGEPVVIDFGIAQLPETTRLTLTGMFMGTPGYLAPEVIEGKDSGTASDVHSWGATVAFAASGRPPYGTGPYETIFYRIMHGAPDLDTLPDPLRAVVLAALARDPARRPSAAELGQQVAAIDPAALIPDRPTITRPMTTSSPSDVRDLLPPVSYQPAGQPGPGGQPAGRYPAAPAGLAAGAGLANGADLAHGAGQAAGAGQPGGAGLAGRPDPFGSWLPGEPAAQAPGGPRSGPRRDGGAGRTVGPVSAWSPLVIATVAMIVAVSVMAPVIGTAIALAVLVALRAVATTGRHLAKRRAGGGGGGLPLLAVALYPLAALRAVFGLLLVAPVALLAFCVAAAAAIIAIPVHPLPQAVALGAGALVAVVGLGPGSSGSRSALASVYTAAARSASLLAVAYVGVLAVAVWAGLTAWYQSPAPAYWPINSVHTQLLHLPTIHTMLTDVRHNLLRLAHQIGL